MKECCGNCKHHKYDRYGDDWVCINEESEYMADYTDYNDSCYDWEERDE